MPKLISGLAALAIGLTAGAALAQQPDAPLKGRDTDPNLLPQSQTPPEKVRPDDGTTGNGTLSEKLEKNDGVIKPPGNAAPGMVVKPPEPNAGTMPVIKPGELPGQQPNTEAK
ncbi:hypothetical protein [Methylobacterium oxalidis]|uniref:Uncharacterized protein n=1 Tax=Methylobacterium oxalidis TaxID=944322 RepID=A0A512J675_9HYPH|nr:hypothetical protein [Methylobacterium oxalidis]GEP05410.1 hypothetical protein MOX02_34480 [Methylobacterium oxalidis]GJE34513.1 hypothetical protein LDDCCGHA_4724 [Methylobacterium oxalidis]GLS66300.1 hypothetical protein GCM10007888_46820 [Methylobacterium oxalidis]